MQGKWLIRRICVVIKSNVIYWPFRKAKRQEAVFLMNCKEMAIYFFHYIVMVIRNQMSDCYNIISSFRSDELHKGIFETVI